MKLIDYFYRIFCPFCLVGPDGSTDGTSSGLVRNPIERILGPILTFT